MYSKPIKVVYTFYCSFFSKPISLFPVVASWQPLALFMHGPFFYLIAQAVHQRLFSFLLFFFFSKPLLTSGKRAKCIHFSRELFRSVCVAVVHSLLFYLEKLSSRVLLRTCDVSFTRQVERLYLTETAMHKNARGIWESFLYIFFRLQSIT